jgi:hypothetical protein
MHWNSRRSSTLRLALSQVADARLWYGIVISPHHYLRRARRKLTLDGKMFLDAATL